MKLSVAKEFVRGYKKNVQRRGEKVNRVKLKKALIRFMSIYDNEPGQP